MNELEGKRILIVEDDMVNMAVYAVSLKQSGAQVIQDYWNSDTVNLLSRHLPVDVILLDLMLRHKVSGYEVYDKLRTFPEFKGIPVIAVSAADPETEIPVARARGFAGFLSKPINPRTFVSQIATCMNGTPIWQNQ
jgi:CheY-like chemotaxis protein